MKKVLPLLLIIVLLLSSGCEQNESADEGDKSSTAVTSKPEKATKSFSVNVDYLYYRRHGATIIEDDQYIYYRTPSGIDRADKYTGAKGTLQKVERPNYIQVFGEYVYFNGGSDRIRRVKKTGGNVETVFDCQDYASQLDEPSPQFLLYDFFVTDDCIYINIHFKMYKFDPQTKTLEYLLDDVAIYEFCNNAMYYMGLPIGNYTIRKFDLITKEKSDVIVGDPIDYEHFAGDFTTLNDKLYYFTGHDLFEVTRKEKVKICELQSEPLYVTVYKNNLYFVLQEPDAIYALYKLNGNSAEKVVALVGDCAGSVVIIVNDYVYYYSKLFGEGNSERALRKTSINQRPEESTVSTHESVKVYESTVSTHEAVKDYEYYVKDDYVIVTRYKGTDEIVTIPELMDGKPVKVIGDNAFYQHKYMKSVILPQTLAEIQTAAFYRCYSLESIKIPKNVNKVDSGAFFRCSSIENIFVEKENPYFSDINGVLYNKDVTELIAYPEGKPEKSFSIPDTVKKVNPGFGYHPLLETLKIPESVKEMPDYDMFIYPEDITLLVKRGSVAEQYAKLYDLKYKYY